MDTHFSFTAKQVLAHRMVAESYIKYYKWNVELLQCIHQCCSVTERCGYTVILTLTMLQMV